MADVTFPTIPDDVLIDIQVSGTFYKKLFALSIALGDSRPIEEYKAALETLNDKEATDLYQLTVQTVVAILFEVEKAAKAQNKTKLVKVNDEGEASDVTES